MTNAVANSYPDNITNSEPNPKYKPISSAYLVMLRRYLNHIRDPDQDYQDEMKGSLSDAFLETTIPLQRIVPTLRLLAESLGHEAFGLSIGRQMHPSDYGLFGYAMMNCDTLFTALQTAARHKVILNQNLNASFQSESDAMVYQICPSSQSRTMQILTELDFSTALRFGQLLVGPQNAQDVKLHSVHFMHSPLGPISLYEERFGCPVLFNSSRSCLKVSREVLSKPIYAANPKLLKVLEDKITKVTLHYEQSPNTLADRVHHHLANQNYQDLPSVTEVATSFNMSLSSFKKHLQNEETCYQDICNQIRYERCLIMMKDPRLAIKKIAFDLGFSNPSAFNRAFKRWTGQSPAKYRKELLLEHVTE